MRFLLCAFLLIATALVSPGATLEQVLAAMDKSAPAFRDMQAKLTREDYTAVIKDTTQETGSVQMKRAAKDVRLRIEFAQPDPRTVVFEKATAQIFYPKINTVQIYDLGKQRSLVDQFLLLGFGSSGAELAKGYNLKAIGDEQVFGEAVTRLELTPKNAAAKEHLKRAELWVAASGYPLQQKFHRPSGDYTLITYKDLRINVNLPDSTFRLSLPRGVKTEYPQK